MHLPVPTQVRAGHMPTGLVGSERDRRHSHHHPRSAPHGGFSGGPGVCGSRSPYRL